MEDKTFKIDLFDEEVSSLKTNLHQEKVEETDREIIKVSLNMYETDWLNLTMFRAYKVTKQKELEYSLADAFIYGLSLLEKKYKIERGKEKINLDRGRREGEKRKKKSSSIDLPSEKLDFINDFLYFKKIEKELMKYSRLDMFSEMVTLIKQKNKEIDWV